MLDAYVSNYGLFREDNVVSYVKLETNDERNLV
jgi:hypothetical protein